MRARSIGFKRGQDSKRSLKLGEGLLGEFKDLIDADSKGVIQAIERYDDSGILSIEAYAPGFKGSMPKIYINQLIKKMGLGKYIKSWKTYIPYKHSSTHFHRFKISREYEDSFPRSFRLSIYGDDRMEW